MDNNDLLKKEIAILNEMAEDYLINNNKKIRPELQKQSEKVDDIINKIGGNKDDR